MTMTGLLSLPPELLVEIIQACSRRDRRQFRATSKILNELAVPIVFRRLCFFNWHSPHIAEQQIVSLATQCPKACEFTKDAEIKWIPISPRATELSWPHFGQCNDIRVHIPTALSMLRNMTRFRWMITHNVPGWLINSLVLAVANCPELTELNIMITCRTSVPLGLFGNLSKLVVQCTGNGDSSFIPQMAIVIANSPQLRSLRVIYGSHKKSLPTLSELFARLSPQYSLALEHLHIGFMDATVDQVTLPHLMQLTSFQFEVRDMNVAQRVWTSFLANNIKLSEVVIIGTIAEETLSYLSSFSGLKSLTLSCVRVPSTAILANLKTMLTMEVIPKHVDSLQKLRIMGMNAGQWVFDYASLKPALHCLKLRDLYVHIDGKESGMPVQLFLDSVAHLPMLEVLHLHVADLCEAQLANFKPSQGLRYLEEVEINYRWYVLEKDGGRPVRYICQGLKGD